MSSPGAIAAKQTLISNKTPPHTITIGTRGSQLALWQANHAKTQLAQAGLDAEIKVIKTQGDRRQNVSFSQLKGIGFFTKEIELALLNEEIDLAVHSHKDLATQSPEGLTIAAVSYREVPEDVLLIRPENYDQRASIPLQQGSLVGTSSPRRRNQLNSFRPDLTFEDLRGNVHTRVKKLKNRQYDAIVMAAAGIKRGEVNLDGLETHTFAPFRMVPAPAQGVLAYQVRTGDQALIEQLQKINERAVQRTTALEREVLRLLEGGCQLPIGVYCMEENGQYHLWCSMAEESTDFPGRVYLNTREPDGWPEKVVRKLQQDEPRSVFITSDLPKESYFYRALTAHGHTVHPTSMITFTPLPVETLPECDWIFFSSKRAVRFFFEQTGQRPEKMQWGVIGPGTGQALRQYGFTPDFEGKSGDTTEVGRNFAVKAGGRKVVFPMSQNSLRTVQQAAGTQIEAIDLPVYTSRPKRKVAIPRADILVFTSPLNVRSYLAQKSILPEQTVVAIGPKTGQALEKAGTGAYHLPYRPGMLHLADTVFSL